MTVFGVFGTTKAVGRGLVSMIRRGQHDALVNVILDDIPEDRHDFDFGIRKGMAVIIVEIISPWFKQCIEKYSEQEFHRLLANGFNFISDWEMNHPGTFNAIVRRARPLRRVMRWGEKDMTNKLANLAIALLEEQGWVVYQSEKQLLYNTFDELGRRING